MELYLHSPLRLHGTELEYLSIRTNVPWCLILGPIERQLYVR
jgi:hypothetical protein